ncbi:MAG: endonuclease/exonuclease/phosphatase family protein [Planctomycetota bacterium]
MPTSRTFLSLAGHAPWFAALSLAVLIYCVRAGQAEEPAKVLRKKVILVTFNIHHARGADNTLDLDRVADVVAPADLVALQEVDNHFDRRSDFVDQARYLANRLDRHWVYAANVDLAAKDDSSSPKLGALRRQYGVALLSRFPITYSRNYPLPIRRGKKGVSEQRGLLETQVRMPGGELRVYVTHLAHGSKEERLLQVRRIRDVLAEAEKGGPPIAGVPFSSSWVIAGDFNFRPESEEYRLFTDAGDGLADKVPVDVWPVIGRGSGVTVGVGTLRSSRIDYVWVSPELRPCLLAARVDEETRASDHQPLFVEWSVP